MTDFEKALEEQFEKYEPSMPQSFTLGDIMEKSFDDGARWAREFTVREVCDYLKSLEDKYFYSCEGGISPIKWADIVKQHFKDRGGE